MQASRPLIGVIADRRELDGFPFHMAGEKYLRAVTDAVGGIPMVIPALSADIHRPTLLKRLDGILLTGSLSNVLPKYYSGSPSSPGTLHDPDRDALALPLTEDTLSRGVPMMAVCRGFQELNVALGGTLHQQIGSVEGHINHQADATLPIAQRYAPLHDVAFTPGGLLHDVTGVMSARVNSLHDQGVNRLAEGVTVEARAPDGVIEAFTVDNATNFALAVQWHPEYEPLKDATSTAIFAAFGAACGADVRNEP